MTKYNKIRRVFFLFAFIFLTLHGTLRQASANWYVGTPSIQDYGVSANISAPSSPPYMEPVPSTQQYHWVSTISDSWIQIGWSYGLNYPKPLSYVEICLVHCTLVPRYFVEFEPHPFGATRNYKVEHISGTVWCAYVDGQQKECRSVVDAPVAVSASSEVIASSNNEINTHFSDVSHKNSGGYWSLFNPSFPISSSCPYLGSGDSSNFYSFRGSCVYVPTITQGRPILINGETP